MQLSSGAGAPQPQPNASAVPTSEDWLTLNVVRAKCPSVFFDRILAMYTETAADAPAAMARSFGDDELLASTVLTARAASQIATASAFREEQIDFFKHAFAQVRAEP
jgi:hypothetical protein